MKSIARQVADKLGGSWRYDGQVGWNSDDGRRVSRVHTGGFDVNGEAMPGYGYFTSSGERLYVIDRSLLTNTET